MIDDSLTEGEAVRVCDAFGELALPPVAWVAYGERPEAAFMKRCGCVLADSDNLPGLQR